MSRRKNKQNHLRAVPTVSCGPDDSIDMPGVHKVEGDSNAMACWIKNVNKFDITLVSQLEQYYPQVKEAKDFVRKVIKPGEEILVPHQYFDIEPHDVPRAIAARPAKKGEADFLYPLVKTPVETLTPG